MTIEYYLELSRDGGETFSRIAVQGAQTLPRVGDEIGVRFSEIETQDSIKDGEAHQRFRFPDETEDDPVEEYRVEQVSFDVLADKNALTKGPGFYWSKERNKGIYWGKEGFLPTVYALRIDSP